MNLADQPVRSYTKEQQTRSKRVKLTQKQMGDISPKVDRKLKGRSQGICELRKQCDGARAVERAHITGRKQLKRKTTIEDLLHLCTPCHRWFDETIEGIRYKRQLINKED
ncbi:hypothetical protein [Paenibacillus chitinolyticus]|uniref:hypothetical protein n=1 Tax=Paenibacillus chitinolyticus TaxID=79263 RepID=UPI0036503BDA